MININDNTFLIAKGDGDYVLTIDYDYWCECPRDEYLECAEETEWHIVCKEHPDYNLPHEVHPTMSSLDMSLSKDYEVVPLSFLNHSTQHILIGSHSDWDTCECGYAWCKRNEQGEANMNNLREQLNEWNNWANGNCYQAWIYDYNGQLIDGQGGFICDGAEEAYEMQKSYASVFDFDKARDVFTMYKMFFEDKE